jgi:hypothetical protein
MKKFSYDQKGFSLIQVMVIGSVIIGAGALINQGVKTAEARRLQVERRTQEDVVERNLNEYLASPNNCFKNFKNGKVSLSNAGVLGIDSTALQDLKADSMDVDGKIKFNGIAYNFISLDQVNPPSTATMNGVNEMINISANLKTNIVSKYQGGTKVDTDVVKTSQKTVLLPVTFNFYNNNGTYQLTSCASHFSATEKKRYSKSDCALVGGTYNDNMKVCQLTESVALSQRKKNCSAIGGTLNANNDCVLVSKEYIPSGSNLVSKNISSFNLQDAICLIEHNVKKQDGLSSNNELFSKYCKRVKYSGCAENNQFYRPTQGIGELYYGRHSGSSLKNLVNSKFDDGALARSQRMANQLRLSQNKKVKDIIPTFGTGAGSVKTGSKSFSSYLGGFAIGSVLGGITSGSLTSLLSFAVDHACSDDRKVYIAESCQAGKIEVDYIKTEKQKLKCNVRGCKCKWYYEKTYNSVASFQVAQAMLAGNNASGTTADTTEVENDVSTEENTALTSISETINGVKSIEELYATYATISNADNTTPNDPNDEPAVASPAYTSKLKAIIIVKEKELWDNYNKSISTHQASTDPMAELKFIQDSLTYIRTQNPNLIVLTVDDSTKVAISNLNTLESNLVQNLMTAINNSTSLSNLGPDPVTYKSQFSLIDQNIISQLESAYSAKKNSFQFIPQLPGQTSVASDQLPKL